MLTKNRIFNKEFTSYFLVSAIALCVDYASYYILAVNRLLDLPKASVVGYAIGLVVSYVLISGRVFTDGWLRNKKHYELILFFISGLFGIAITYLTVKLFVMVFGERIYLAKFTAVGVSFICVYLVRKYFVFKKVSEHYVNNEVKIYQNTFADKFYSVKTSVYVLLFAIPLVFFLYSLFVLQPYDMDLDTFLYLGSRLDNGEILYANDFETKFPLLQYLFWVPYRLGGIGAWRLITFVISVFWVFISSYLIVSALVFNMPRYQAALKEFSLLTAACFLILFYCLPGAESAHIAMLAAVFMYLAIALWFTAANTGNHKADIYVFWAAIATALAISIRPNYIFAAPSLVIITLFSLIHHSDTFKYKDAVRQIALFALVVCVTTLLSFAPYLFYDNGLAFLKAGLLSVWKFPVNDRTQFFALLKGAFFTPKFYLFIVVSIALLFAIKLFNKLQPKYKKAVYYFAVVLAVFLIIAVCFFYSNLNFTFINAVADRLRDFLATLNFYLFLYIGLAIAFILNFFNKQALQKNEFFKVGVLLCVVSVAGLDYSFIRSHYFSHYSIMFVPYAAIMFAILLISFYEQSFFQKGHRHTGIIIIVGLFLLLADPVKLAIKKIKTTINRPELLSLSINDRNIDDRLVGFLSKLTQAGYSFYFPTDVKYHSLLKQKRIGDGHPEILRMVLEGERIGPVNDIYLYSQEVYQNPCLAITHSLKDVIVINSINTRGAFIKKIDGQVLHCLEVGNSDYAEIHKTDDVTQVLYPVSGELNYRIFVKQPLSDKIRNILQTFDADSFVSFSRL